MYLYPIVDYVNMFEIRLKANFALCSINQGNIIDLPIKNKIMSEWFNIHYYPIVYIRVIVYFLLCHESLNY